MITAGKGTRVMSSFRIFVTIVVAATWCLAGGTAESRMRYEAGSRDATGPMAAGRPAEMVALHNVGRIVLAVANNGTFGKEYTGGDPSDHFTGEAIPLNCEYPKGSRVSYLFGGAFWIGAVVGRDTLVSTGADGWQLIYEMHPDESPFGDIIYRSIKDPTDLKRYEGAVSEQDLIAVYTDTFTQNIQAEPSTRPHIPLNIEVTQSSYAWSYAYAEDFVLFDYQIKNIGTRTLQDVYMGIYVDAMVCFDCMGTRPGFQDDLSGFLNTYRSAYGTSCNFDDTVFIAWQADNDGDPDVVFDDGLTHPCPDAVATRIVRTPNDTLDVSFNWWIGNMDPQLDFGPRERSYVGRWKEPFRDFGTEGLGTPENDRNKYYVMRNREFDYDQFRTASIGVADSLWMYPDQNLAADYADGYDTRYLLSFGPFQIIPGQSLPISFAYVGGQDIHHVAGNVANLPSNPDAYYANLDFTDLALNATWASWVYDNPGYDTDGDGDSGDFHVCYTDSAMVFDTISIDPPQIDTSWVLNKSDTVWYVGDGEPDFRGAAPPPAPAMQLKSPSGGAIQVRFNGLRSETTRDVFSHDVDFEGYRIYIGRDERESSFSLVASYDREDYNKYVWDAARSEWNLYDPPFLLDSLRCFYGDSCNDPYFDPLVYTRTNRYVMPGYPDSQFFFVAQDYNVGANGSDGIRKLYPNQGYPSSLNPDSAAPDELTPEGNFKYFEYEYTIEDLLSTVPYYVNVTAFDFGSPKANLTSLESSVTNGAELIYPTIDDTPPEERKIIVYPNPYRIDGGYRANGFEGRLDIDRAGDRVRAIHFANLPPRCTIRIFTLDGDLVREIYHDRPPGSGDASHDSWDLITRNTQLVVSGLYYWTVEDDNGEVTIGKLAIIM